MAATDFNNDGKMDLAVTINSFGSVSILLGDGAGGFAPPLTTLLSDALYPWHL
ncbi:MAG: FG-GAP-like repeat [Acidobacteriota bacterium]|nr:FG-GAP-like repeat [Acidobacteriota bacterium]